MRSRSTIIMSVVLAAALWGKVDAMAASNEEVATLAGGCFWCMEAMFEQLQGVSDVVSGFAGGDAQATYEQVCTGETGHAEVIQVTFDPSVITFRDILTVFFGTHDPTTLNRQGADTGEQYRSAVFYHDEAQKNAAVEAIALLEKEQVFTDPVVTQLAAFKGFVEADEHHQNYYQRNLTQRYCQAVISPKMAKFRAHFADRLK